MTYTYDARGRLVAETRNVNWGNTPGYDFSYGHDQGGNRVVKFDLIGEREVDYTYDTSAPSTYGSDNNRLMFYETYDTTGQSRVLLSTTFYYYNAGGNVERIVTRDEVNPNAPLTATRFVYDPSQQVRTMLGESWNPVTCDGSGSDNYTVTWAREFRYDSARGRYLNRELDPTQLTPSGNTGDLVSLSDTWTDYDGDTTYGDFTTSQTSATNTRAYEPGLAKQDPWGQSSAVSYYGSDPIGTRPGHVGVS